MQRPIAPQPPTAPNFTPENTSENTSLGYLLTGPHIPHISGSAWEEGLLAQVILQIKTVFDPEIPRVDIYELGLIYRLDMAEGGKLHVDMTLTSPNCPVAGEMPGMVQRAVGQLADITECDVNITFEPPWEKTRMSEAALLELNMF